MTDYIRYELSDSIATLNMDDGKANAYGPDMIAALASGLDRAADEAKAVIISGRPGVLCAGFDLRIIRGGDPDAAAAMRSAGKALLLKAYLHPQPIVFACTEHALAAGVVSVEQRSGSVAAAYLPFFRTSTTSFVRSTFSLANTTPVPSTMS